MTNNNDLPSTIVAPGGITLPDVLTESDLFMNLDASLLLPPSLNLEPGGKQPAGALDFGSQLLPDSSFRRSVSQEPARLEDHTLVDLDLGEDEVPLGNDMSVEIGRDAPAPRPVEEDLFSDAGKFNDVDLALDLGDDDVPLDRMDFSDHGAHGDVDNLLRQDDAMDLDGDLGSFVPGGDDDDAAQRIRDSTSPLSDHGHEVGHFDDSILRAEQEDDEADAEAMDVATRHRQRAKRRRLIVADTDIMLRTNQIREQQADRSEILRPASFLPRDPILLTLMNMQKSGEFVSSVVGEGRGRGWAPELRALFSFGAIKKAGDLKRKRDSAIADMDLDAYAAPALDLGDDETSMPFNDGVALDTSAHERSEIDFPGDDQGGSELVLAHDADEGIGHAADDESQSGLLADSGPMSVGTQHAVHTLRTRLGSEQKQSSVLFQELLPERHSSKADATKMFFEVLALATKDAVKLEQAPDTIGGPLRIRGKRALWSSSIERVGDATSQVTV